LTVAFGTPARCASWASGGEKVQIPWPLGVPPSAVPLFCASSVYAPGRSRVESADASAGGHWASLRHVPSLVSDGHRRVLDGRSDAEQVLVVEAHDLVEPAVAPHGQAPVSVDVVAAHVVPHAEPRALGAGDAVEEVVGAVGLRVVLDEALGHEERDRRPLRLGDEVARLPEGRAVVVALLVEVVGGVAARARRCCPRR
jgi:hypothetical protein